jgi:hypothetical protein
MSDLILAAEAIEKAAKQQEHFVKAAAALKRIGSLEQAESEATDRLALLRSQREQAERDLLSKQQEVQSAQATALEITDAAQAQAQRRVKEAEDAAQAQLDKARIESDALRAASSLEAANRLGRETIAKVHEEAEAIRAQAKADASELKAAARAEVDSVKREKADIEALRDQVKVQKGLVDAELAAVNAKLAAARAEIRRLLGAD